MLLRGASVQSLFAQFFGRADEPLKGRRLPLLLGDRAINIGPCMTQVGAYLPHAAGAAEDRIGRDGEEGVSTSCGRYDSPSGSAA